MQPRQSAINKLHDKNVIRGHAAMLHQLYCLYLDIETLTAVSETSITRLLKASTLLKDK